MNLINYKDTVEKKIRMERLNRIQSLEMQITYLCAFINIMETQYQVKFNTTDKQLQFYASAYNSGFMRGFDNIMKYTELNFFPYGKNYQGNKKY